MIDRHPKRWGGFLLALILLAALWGCATNPATGKQQLALLQISSQQEVELGRKTFPRVIQQMGGSVDDRSLELYVSEVGSRLAAVSHRPELTFRFRVVNDSSPNAFALPGGFIAVTRGLLVNLENEAQLASVLGHEVAHVTARHSVQGMQRGALLNVALGVLSGATAESSYGPLAEQAGQLAANLVDKSYSRDQERESDRLGIDYMVAAGYDPQGAIQLQEFFFHKMEQGAEPNWLTGLFRSHPFSKERLEANRDYVAVQYPRAAGAKNYRLGEERFRIATADLRATREGYALYDQARRLEAEGKLSEAIQTYQRAIDAAPEQGLIYTGMGLAHLRADDLVSARRYLVQAVRLDEDYYLSRQGLGYVHLTKGEPQQAVEQLEQAMELLPTLQGAFLLAEGYEKSGRNDEAVELYRAVAQADPGGKLGQAALKRLQALGAG